MIRKPNIVKGIPSPLVRALPMLYYYGRYVKETIPPKAKNLFENYLKYLIEALNKMDDAIPNCGLPSITNEVAQLQKLESDKIESAVFEITRKLSEFCVQNSDVLKSRYEGDKGLKQSFVELFRNIIQTTKIALIDNNNQPGLMESLAKKLEANCYYEIAQTTAKARDFSDVMVNVDFGIFTSATPQNIHQEIDFLKTYRKPGLILGTLQKDEKLDQQTIRNGAWLKNRGYTVLYKIFSPMRLFTTIDKINIGFLLEEDSG